MKKILSILSVFVLFTLALSLNSCEPNGASNQVKVINSTGTLNLNNFTIKFFNRAGEQLISKDFGDFAPGSTIKMDIPSGASIWLVGAYINHGPEFVFSPQYYLDDVKVLDITYDLVMNGWLSHY